MSQHFHKLQKPPQNHFLLVQLFLLWLFNTEVTFLFNFPNNTRSHITSSIAHDLFNMLYIVKGKWPQLFADPWPLTITFTCQNTIISSSINLQPLLLLSILRYPFGAQVPVRVLGRCLRYGRRKSTLTPTPEQVVYAWPRWPVVQIQSQCHSGLFRWAQFNCANITLH